MTMAIDTDLLIYYSAQATTGGDINTSATIVDNTLNSIFPDVTDAQRVSGLTDYRKIFFRNENSDAFTYPKVYISANTPCTTDAIWVCKQVSNSDEYTSAATYTFYQPDAINHADVLAYASLTENQYFGIWIKRVVDAGSGGYNNDTFTLTTEQATV